MNDYIIREVQMIHRGRGIAILSDGQEVPITNWLDADGDCDPSDAVTCVCGPCVDGNWYSVDLSQYKQAIIN